ncbi:MAG TPA: ABC transporter permease [Candidatus Dormibacteraeota bacterium]
MRPLSRRLWSATWPKLAALAFVLVGWQALVFAGWQPDYLLPGPLPVFQKLGSYLHDPGFYAGVAITLRRAAFGFGLALVIGTLVGVAVTRWRPLRAGIGALLTGLQSMPSIAWFPLAILVLGISETAIGFVVVLGAAPAIANGAIHGIDHIQPALLRSGRSLGARGLSLYRHVVLPAALPSFVAGLKQGWAFSWRSLMAGELLVNFGNRALGAQLNNAREFSDAPGLLATMIVILVIGMVVDGIFGAIDGTLRRRRGLTS